MAKPISVSPSQAWLGNDGRWSTFNIRVGTPSQDIWVIPSTRTAATWVVLDDGCISSDPASCPNDRGHIFKSGNSSTWRHRGIFRISEESNLGYDLSDAGDYGFDTLGLGYRGAGGPTLEAQVLAGIATKDFYLGSLGLYPAPVNFTSEESHPSLLTNLKAQNLIPSLSYGYSAGAYYRLKKVDGTLTLGGYDASRFTPNDVDFTLASDISRDLLVGLQSIRFSDSETTSEELLPEGVFAFIDSTVPHIWLPLKSCVAFEKAFGITYDNSTDRYLVSDSLHDQLLSQNASVTFILGNDIVGGQTVEITLPYLSFDLQANYILHNESSRYFPLRRADNDTQYTLGRTFLQESYLTVNYEQSNFSVSQSIFSEATDEELIPILSPSTNSTIVAHIEPSTPSKKLSPGAIAGIAIAIVSLCIITLSFILVIRRRRRSSAKGPKSSSPPELGGIEKPAEADSTAAWKPGLEMEGNNTLRSAKAPVELCGPEHSAEMEGNCGGRAELHGSATDPTAAAAVAAAIELDAGPIPNPITTHKDGNQDTPPQKPPPTTTTTTSSSSRGPRTPAPPDPPPPPPPP